MVNNNYPGIIPYVSSTDKLKSDEEKVAQKEQRENLERMKRAQDYLGGPEPGVPYMPPQIEDTTKQKGRNGYPVQAARHVRSMVGSLLDNLSKPEAAYPAGPPLVEELLGHITPPPPRAPEPWAGYRDPAAFAVKERKAPLITSEEAAGPLMQELARVYGPKIIETMMRGAQEEHQTTAYRPFMLKKDGSLYRPEDFNKLIQEAGRAGDSERVMELEKQYWLVNKYWNAVELDRVEKRRAPYTYEPVEEAIKTYAVAPSVYLAQKLPYTGQNQMAMRAEQYRSDGHGWFESAAMALKDPDVAESIPPGLIGALLILFDPLNLVPIVGWPGLVTKPMRAAYLTTVRYMVTGKSKEAATAIQLLHKHGAGALISPAGASGPETYGTGLKARQQALAELDGWATDSDWLQSLSISEKNDLNKLRSELTKEIARLEEELSVEATKLADQLYENPNDRSNLQRVEVEYMRMLDELPPGHRLQGEIQNELQNIEALKTPDPAKPSDAYTTYDETTAKVFKLLDDQREVEASIQSIEKGLGPTKEVIDPSMPQVQRAPWMKGAFRNKRGQFESNFTDEALIRIASEHRAAGGGPISPYEADWWDNIAREDFEEIRREPGLKDLKPEGYKSLHEQTFTDLEQLKSFRDDIERQLEDIYAERPALKGIEAPRIGAIQAGMGIGERPQTGQLLPETLGEGRIDPIIDPEQLIAKQARLEAIRQGQTELPIGVVFAQLDEALNESARAIEEASTAKKFEGVFYRGYGRETIEEAYDPEAYVQGPIFGEGVYAALNRDYASNFGPYIEELVITLKNPLVIGSDNDWTALGRKAGWRSSVPMDQGDIVNMRKAIEQAGHDGVVIRVPDTEQFGKRLLQVFDEHTVVSFNKQAVKAWQAEPLEPVRNLDQKSVLNLAKKEEFTFERWDERLPPKKRPRGREIEMQASTYFPDPTDVRGRAEYVKGIAPSGPRRTPNKWVKVSFVTGESVDIPLTGVDGIGAKATDEEILKAAHKKIIQQAIEDGVEVPPNVLKDYPDVAKRAKELTKDLSPSVEKMRKADDVVDVAEELPPAVPEPAAFANATPIQRSLIQQLAAHGITPPVYSTAPTSARHFLKSVRDATSIESPEGLMRAIHDTDARIQELTKQLDGIKDASNAKRYTEAILRKEFDIKILQNEQHRRMLLITIPDSQKTAYGHKVMPVKGTTGKRLPKAALDRVYDPGPQSPETMHPAVADSLSGHQDDLLPDTGAAGGVDDGGRAGITGAGGVGGEPPSIFDPPPRSDDPAETLRRILGWLDDVATTEERNNKVITILRLYEGKVGAQTRQLEYQVRNVNILLHKAGYGTWYGPKNGLDLTFRTGEHKAGLGNAKGDDMQKLWQVLHGELPPGDIPARFLEHKINGMNVYEILREIVDLEEVFRLNLNPNMAVIPEDYFPRGWVHPDQKPPSYTGLTTPTPSFMQARTRRDTSFIEMLEQGFEPWSWNPGKMAYLSALEGILYREKLIAVDILDRLGLLLRPDESLYGDIIKIDGITYRSPKGLGSAFDGVKEIAYKENGELVEFTTGKVYVHENIATRLEAVYAPARDVLFKHVVSLQKLSDRLPSGMIPKEITVDFNAVVDALTFIPKRIKLMFSFFQLFDFLGRMGNGLWAAGTHLLARGNKIEAVKKMLVMPIQSQADIIMTNIFPNRQQSLRKQWTSKEPLWPDHPNPAARTLTPYMVMEAGVSRIDPQMLLDNMDGAIRLAQRDVGIRGRSKQVLRLVQKLEKGMREGLFHGTYPRAQYLSMKNVDGPMIAQMYPDMTTQQLAGAIARSLNKRFSTIPASQSIFQGRLVRWSLARLFFSVGEFEGLFRQMTSVLTPGVRKYWMLNWVGNYLGLIATANAIHFASTTSYSDLWNTKDSILDGDMPDGFGGGLPIGRWTPIRRDVYQPLGYSYNPSFASPNIPFRDRGGEQMMLDIVMQLDTVFKIISPFSFFQSRLSVPLRATQNQIVSTDFYGNPINTKGPLGIWSRTAQGLVDLFVPIGFGQSMVTELGNRVDALEGFIPTGESRIGGVGRILESPGVNLKSHSNADLRNTMAKRSGFRNLNPHSQAYGHLITTWNKLDPRQQQHALTMFPDLAAELNLRKQEAAGRGDIWALASEEAQKIRNEALIGQINRDTLEAKGLMSKREWRDLNNAAREQNQMRIRDLFKDVDLPEREQTITDKYYDLLDTAYKRHPLDRNARWEFVDTTVATWNDEEQWHVDNVSGIGKSTARQKEFYSAMDVLADYLGLSETEDFQQEVLDILKQREARLGSRGKLPENIDDLIEAWSKNEYNQRERMKESTNKIENLVDAAATSLQSDRRKIMVYDNPVVAGYALEWEYINKLPSNMSKTSVNQAIDDYETHKGPEAVGPWNEFGIPRDPQGTYIGLAKELRGLAVANR